MSNMLQVNLALLNKFVEIKQMKLILIILMLCVDKYCSLRSACIVAFMHLN
jgi:hypothetical protein